MAKARKVYWDSGLFISYLSDTHPKEKERADIVRNLLKHAMAGDLEVWTSVWTIAEVIRPKTAIPAEFPLPDWAELLNAKDEKGNIKFPKATNHFTQIWEYHQRNTLPERRISDQEANQIKGMFDWPWINTVDVVPTVANKATEFMRSYNMKAGDAIHAASALYRNCEVLHAWDRDFSKTNHLIGAEQPKRMSDDLPETPGLFKEGT